MAALPIERLDLRPTHLGLLRSLLARELPHAEIWAFGSRVHGNGHEASDLDLVVRNPAALLTPTPGVAALREALVESNLPIRVDLLDWAELKPHFWLELERAYVVVQAVAPGTGAADQTLGKAS